LEFTFFEHFFRSLSDMKKVSDDFAAIDFFDVTRLNSHNRND